ncbi:MAG: hypothetical protein A3H96_07055 [Acidobacteria bacterium RIFCSPLOWO2_02_FULL_67_36]|nr:MAG: hypothetical protein A3H96_07055 [Acidobacteria bacterium RIFCSPLOWO2_02_FULL_67_36]OFW26516.1 MAG: hypothetical protein A3G21_24265 [Acidobacteria bacterium RIFCSPLOWO2_12_FULL_66_21]
MDGEHFRCSCRRDGSCLPGPCLGSDVPQRDHQVLARRRRDTRLDPAKLPRRKVVPHQSRVHVPDERLFARIPAERGTWRRGLPNPRRLDRVTSSRRPAACALRAFTVRLPGGAVRRLRRIDVRVNRTDDDNRALQLGEVVPR